MAAIKATNPNNANEILKKGVCPSEYLKLKKESTKSKTTVRLSKRPFSFVIVAKTHSYPLIWAVRTTVEIDIIYSNNVAVVNVVAYLLDI
jgi:hypothetical protein